MKLENVVKEEKYVVMQKGGSIGSKHGVVASFDNKKEATEKAKRMNKLLSPGEKKYYKIRYIVKTIKESLIKRKPLREVFVATIQKDDKDVKAFMRIWKDAINTVGNTPDYTDKYGSKVKRIKDNRDSRLNKGYGVYTFKGNKFDVSNDTDAYPKLKAFERAYFIVKI